MAPLGNGMGTEDGIISQTDFLKMPHNPTVQAESATAFVIVSLHFKGNNAYCYLNTV